MIITDIPLVLMAGGKSSRMGRDKSLLPFGKFPTLAQFQYNRFSTLFQDVYISAKTNKFDFECKVIEDTQKEFSPLIALISIFEKLKVDEVFILSVDAPFVDQNTLKDILRHIEETRDIIVAQSPSGIQPLCGYYKKSILPLAYAQLEKKEHKLLTLLSLVNTKYVSFEDDVPFTNLNHPKEYEDALKRF